MCTYLTNSELSQLERMLSTLRLSGLSRVVPPISHPSAVALFGSASAAAAVVGFLADTWPVVRRSSQRRDVKPFWRAQPTQADGPGFLESTSTSCVPLHATTPAASWLR